MDSMDKLNAIYGQQKIKIATQDVKKVWKMKQEKLSPCYTTRLNDIIMINV
jgi:DNA polymerase V